MSTSFLYAQAPNRKGNISKNPPSMSGGCTDMTGPKHGLSAPGGQGPAKATGSPLAGRGQKVMMECHCDYDGAIKNSGYMSSSYKK